MRGSVLRTVSCCAPVGDGPPARCARSCASLLAAEASAASGPAGVEAIQSNDHAPAGAVATSAADQQSGQSALMKRSRTAAPARGQAGVAGGAAVEAGVGADGGAAWGADGGADGGV